MKTVKLWPNSRTFCGSASQRSRLRCASRGACRWPLVRNRPHEKHLKITLVAVGTTKADRRLPRSAAVTSFSEPVFNIALSAAEGAFAVFLTSLATKHNCGCGDCGSVSH